MHIKTILNRIEKQPGFIYESCKWRDPGPPALVITSRPQAGSKPICSKCGERRPGYDTLRTRSFQFVPLWGILAFFLYAPRRVHCPTCGIRVEKLPWAKGKSHLTITYAWFLATWCKRLSWNRTTTTNASINGFDGVKLANTAMQMKIHGAAHSFASNTGLEKILNETSSVGQGSAANKGFTESLRTSFQSSFDRQLQDGSDFSKHARNEEISKVGAMVRVGGSFMGFRFGANGEVAVQGADGHQVSEKFSESTVKALKTAQDRAWNESISNVASSTQGMNWLRGVAQRVGNTEAFSMLDEARNINRSQQSFGENLTTAMVRDYAINRYHEETSETIRKSMDNISHFLTHGGAAGVATVNDISQSFLNRMGHQGNSAAVQSTIDNYSSHVAGGGGLKSEAHQAVARAEFNTKGVISDNFDPNHKFPSPPDLPSSSTEIEREANARKEANQKGVKNGGSIQHPVTNAAEKALDFIGGP